MPLTSYTIERTFTVAPERLFRAFVDPEDLKVWVWGAGARGVEADLDVRPGGRLCVTTEVEGPDGKTNRFGWRGVVLEVDPGRRLVHTLHWDAPVGYNEPGMNPVDEAILAEFLPDEQGCRLRYTHLGIPDDGQSAAEHERSVRVTFDDLETHLAASR